MDRSDIITLIKTNDYQDSLGVWHEDEIRRDVFCHVSSATNQEWNAAMQNGLKAAYVFSVFAPDYDNEEVVEYNGNKYSVVRTYRSIDDGLELHCMTKKGTQDE